jgi:hypothetical protein
MTKGEPVEEVPAEEETDDEAVIVPIDSAPEEPQSDPVVIKKDTPKEKPIKKNDSKAPAAPAKTEGAAPPAGFSFAYLYYLFNQVVGFGN